MGKRLKSLLFGLSALIIILIASCSKSESGVKELSILLTSTESSITYEVKIPKVKGENEYKVILSEGLTKVTERISSVDELTYTFNSLKSGTSYTANLIYNNEAIQASIETKASDIEGLVFEDQTFTYDGKPKALEVKNLDGATVTYENNNQVNAGTYEVKATVKKEGFNDKVLTATLTINKARFDSSVLVFEDKAFEYDGSVKSLRVLNLPADILVTYENNDKTVTGVYEVIAKFSSPNYEEIPSMKATLTISKATSEINLQNQSKVYDGNPFELEILGVSLEYYLEDGTKLDSAPTNAGSYMIKAIREESEFFGPATKEVTLTILKRTLLESEIVFNDLTTVYDGSVKSLLIILPYGLTAVLSNNDKTDAGEYDVLATINPNHNFEDFSTYTRKLIINKATPRVEVSPINSTSGVDYTIDVSVIPSSLSYEIVYKQGETVLSSKPTDVGSYTYIVKVTGNNNYSNIEVSSTITILNSSFTDVEIIQENINVNYKEEYNVNPYIEGHTELTLKVTYKNSDGQEVEKPTDAGIYTVLITFDGSSELSLNPQTKKVTLTINKIDATLPTIYQKNFTLDYFQGITVASFKSLLAEKGYTIPDSSLEGFTLNVGDNPIIALYNPNPNNYISIKVKITLKVVAVLESIEAKDLGLQIKGRDLDSKAIEVKLKYNDGTLKPTTNFTVEFKPGYTNTNSSFYVVIKAEGKETEVIINPIEKPALMIYAVYTAGGDSGLPFKREFVVLYNASSREIDLTGYYLTYLAGSNTTGKGTSYKLTGSIKAYGFFIIGGNKTNDSSRDVSYDMLVGIDGAQTAFQYLLSTTQTSPHLETSNVIDKVATANFFEGSAAPATSKTSLIMRKNLVDTDNNAKDFINVSITENKFDFEYENVSLMNQLRANIIDMQLNLGNLESNFTLPTTILGKNVTYRIEGNGLTYSNNIFTIVPTSQIQAGKIIINIEFCDFNYELEYKVAATEMLELEAPVVTQAVSEIKWNSVENATGYEVYLNDTKVATLSSSVTSYKLTISKGNNSVYVIALGDGISYSNKASSTITLAEKASLSDLAAIDNTKAYMFEHLLVTTARLSNAGTSWLFVTDGTNSVQINVKLASSSNLSAYIGYRVSVVGKYNREQNVISVEVGKHKVVSSAKEDANPTVLDSKLSNALIGKYVTFNIGNLDKSFTTGASSYQSFNVGEYTYETNVSAKFVSSTTKFTNAKLGYDYKIYGVVVLDNSKVYIGLLDIEELGESDISKANKDLNAILSKILSSYEASDLELPSCDLADAIVTYSLDQSYSGEIEIRENTIYASTIEVTETVNLNIHYVYKNVILDKALAISFNVISDDDLYSEAIRFLSEEIQVAYTTKTSDVELPLKSNDYSFLTFSYQALNGHDNLLINDSLMLSKVTESIEAFELTVTVLRNGSKIGVSYNITIEIVYIEPSNGGFTINSDTEGKTILQIEKNYPEFIAKSADNGRSKNKANGYPYTFTDLTYSGKSHDEAIVTVPLEIKRTALIKFSMTMYVPSKQETSYSKFTLSAKKGTTAVNLTDKAYDGSTIEFATPLNSTANVTVTNSFILDAGVYVYNFAFTRVNNTYLKSLSYKYDYDFSASATPNLNTENLGVPNSNFQIRFLELGNANAGDSIYIKAGNNDILIDAGSKRNSSTTINSELAKYVSDSKLEYVIATHAHEDHIAGFIGETNNPNDGVLDNYSVDTLIKYARRNATSAVATDFEALASKASNIITPDTMFNVDGSAKDSSVITLFEEGSEKIEMKVLYNKYYFNKTSDENDYSVCLMFVHTFNNVSYNYIFTGDLEGSGETELVKHYQSSIELDSNGGIPEVVLYKGGHHGSKTSSTEAFLDEIKPQMCVVCCCAGNPEYTKTNANIFPTQEFINRISKHTDYVFITSMYNERENKNVSMNGVVTVTSTSGTVYVNASNNTTKLKDTAWFNEEIYTLNGEVKVKVGTQWEWVSENTPGAIKAPRRIWPTI